MTPSEQYALERAALEDPLLAEAIEGFERAESTTWQPNLASLEQRIQAHASSQATPTPVVSLPFWKNFRQLAAALLALTALSVGLWALFQPDDAPTVAKQTSYIPAKTDTLIPSKKPTTSTPTAPIETSIPERTATAGMPTTIPPLPAAPPDAIAEVSPEAYTPTLTQVIPPVEKNVRIESPAPQVEENKEIQEDLSERNLVQNAPALQEVSASNAAPRPRNEVIQVEGYKTKKNLDQRNVVSEESIRVASKSAEKNLRQTQVAPMPTIAPQLISYSGGVEPTTGWNALKENVQELFETNTTCNLDPTKIIRIRFLLITDGKWQEPQFVTSDLSPACRELLFNLLDRVQWKRLPQAKDRVELVWSW
jgi:hypothetical protein